jgi:hypothetical protein
MLELRNLIVIKERHVDPTVMMMDRDDEDVMSSILIEE